MMTMMMITKISVAAKKSIQAIIRTLQLPHLHPKRNQGPLLFRKVVAKKCSGYHSYAATSSRKSDDDTKEKQ